VDKGNGRKLFIGGKEYMLTINLHVLWIYIISILTIFNFIAIIHIAKRWKWVELMRKEIWPSFNLSIRDIKNKSWISNLLRTTAQTSAAYRAHLDKFHRKFKKNEYGYPEEISYEDYNKWAL
jgi:hypothetical protein